MRPEPTSSEPCTPALTLDRQTRPIDREAVPAAHDPHSSSLPLRTAMKGGLLGGTLRVSPRASPRRPVLMLHAGLDLSRRKVEVCLLSSEGEVVDEWASPPDGDGVRGLAARAAMWGPAVRGVIESMNGARFVHDRLEEHGWDVLIADATKVKGWRRWRARPT